MQYFLNTIYSLILLTVDYLLHTFILTKLHYLITYKHFFTAVIIFDKCSKYTAIYRDYSNLSIFCLILSFL